MAHVGVICPPLQGHLNPSFALSLELKSRGHRVTYFGTADWRVPLQKMPVDFVELPSGSLPIGSVDRVLRWIWMMPGFIAALLWLFFFQRLYSKILLKHLASAIIRSGVDFLMVDETEPAAATVAELGRIPFVSVSHALFLRDDPWVPPFFTGFSFGTHRWQLIRNHGFYRVGFGLLALLNLRLLLLRWRGGLPCSLSGQTFLAVSSDLHLAQQSASFDFPRRLPLGPYFGCGPFRRSDDERADAPCESWGRFVLVSFGTIQGRHLGLVRALAHAAAQHGLTMVFAHCGRYSAQELARLPGRVLGFERVPYAAVLPRSELVVTHGGLNTVLDSLVSGVPLLVLPMAYEQGAVASRVRYLGAGLSLPRGLRGKRSLTLAMGRLIHEPQFRRKAAALAQDLTRGGGCRVAVDHVEEFIRRKRLGSFQDMDVTQKNEPR